MKLPVLFFKGNATRGQVLMLAFILLILTLGLFVIKIVKQPNELRPGEEYGVQYRAPGEIEITQVGDMQVITNKKYNTSIAVAKDWIVIPSQSEYNMISVADVEASEFLEKTLATDSPEGIYIRFDSIKNTGNVGAIEWLKQIDDDYENNKLFDEPSPLDFRPSKADEQMSINDYEAIKRTYLFDMGYSIFISTPSGLYDFFCETASVISTKEEQLRKCDEVASSITIKSE